MMVARGALFRCLAKVFLSYFYDVMKRNEGKTCIHLTMCRGGMIKVSKNEGGDYEKGVFFLLAILLISVFLFVGCNEPHVHEWDEGKITIPATCAKEGVKVYTCNGCKETKTERIPVLKEHTWNTGVVTTWPTCVEEGIRTFTCIVCNQTQAESINALDHDMHDIEAKAETCTEVGWDAYQKCSRCDYSTNYVEKQALGHNKIFHNAKAPSCTEAGYDAYNTCSRCAYTTKEDIPAIGHTWNSGEMTTAVTCTADGVKTYVCTVCKEAKNESILATGHNCQTFEVKEPTCTEKGWDAYQKCSSCDYSTYVEKPALGHSLTLHYQAKEATCTEEGYEDYDACSREGCAYATKVVIEALGHDFNGIVTTIEATCTTPGSTTIKCTRCDAVNTKVITIDSNAHSYSPTLSSDASGHWFACTNTGCSSKKNASNHTEATKTTATCTESGTKTIYCTVCNFIIKTEADVTTKHLYVNYKCSSCGLWGIGPAGGYVFYDCDADNDSGNADGLTSSECGWRYLEAAPSDLDSAYRFGYYRASDSDDNATIGTGGAVGTGKSNTDGLVKAMGKTAYASKSGAEKGIYAAKGCADYSITVDGKVYDDWFLPSKDELALMYDNLKVKGLGSFVGDCYWSSSESSYGTTAGIQSFYSNVQGFNDRDGSYSVRPIRAFIECIGSVNHSWDTGVVTKQESCGSAGELEYTCTVCGRTRTEVICATDNHTWDGGKVTKQETCTTEGARTFICSVCNQTKTEGIPATGHADVNYKCTICDLWGMGPAGGYVFYDCDADNDSGNADGLTSSECGWRYLEAAPADLGRAYPFGFYRSSSSGYNSNVNTKTAIGSGKTNTEALVKKMGKTTYIKSSGGVEGIYAAKACADYSITVDGKVYDDWFLPSKNELNLIYANLYKNGLGSFGCFDYWSSSEGFDSYKAWD